MQISTRIFCSVVQEADKYLQSGFYSGELGDTMVLAISNALKLVIIVLSSILSDHPIINISPRAVTNPTPIYLAFNQYGTGHYDGLVENTEIPSPPLENSIVHVVKMIRRTVLIATL